MKLSFLSFGASLDQIYLVLVFALGFENAGTRDRWMGQCR